MTLTTADRVMRYSTETACLQHAKAARRMHDLVDIVIPAAAQSAAETLGLKVSRSVTTGVRIRRISREDAEISVECLRDWGFSARITEPSPDGGDPASPELKRAA